MSVNQTEGVYVNDEVGDYGEIDRNSIPPKFIKDLMENLCVESGGCFAIYGWGKINIIGQYYSEDLDDPYLLFSGERIPLDIVEDEYDEDEDED